MILEKTHSGLDCCEYQEEREDNEEIRATVNFLVITGLWRMTQAKSKSNLEAF